MLGINSNKDDKNEVIYVRPNAHIE